MATGELPLRTHRLPLKMRNLTKRDLVMRVSTETGITQEKVQRIIELALSSITESLAKNENVELRKLGFSRPAGKKEEWEGIRIRMPTDYSSENGRSVQDWQGIQKAHGDLSLGQIRGHLAPIMRIVAVAI